MGPGVDAFCGGSVALRVCETFLASEPEVEIEGPRPFVYVSAEDIFRPVIPARYIETKREAEVCIEEMIQDNPKFRGVYIRPSASSSLFPFVCSFD